jgi:hypothetical protein
MKWMSRTSESSHRSLWTALPGLSAFAHHGKGLHLPLKTPAMTSWSANLDCAIVGEVLRKSTTSAKVVSEGWRMTRPELSRCDVRGPSMSGVTGVSSVVGFVCFDRPQFAGTLQSVR